MQEQCRERYGVTLEDNLGAKAEWERTEREGSEVLSLRISWDPAQAAEVPEPCFALTFSVAQKGIAHIWHPVCGLDRGLRADWMGPVSYTHLTLPTNSRV